MKCPECGKELSKDDILIPIRSRETGQIIGWQHCNFEKWQTFLDDCDYMGLDPSDVMETLMMAYIKQVKARLRGKGSL